MVLRNVNYLHIELNGGGFFDTQLIFAGLQYMLLSAVTGTDQCIRLISVLGNLKVSSVKADVVG